MRRSNKKKGGVERRLLRQTLGSYYSHDGADPSNLTSLLTSSGGGFRGGRGVSSPGGGGGVVRSGKNQMTNPNPMSRLHAKMKATNHTIDATSYNAFHSRPLIKTSSNNLKHLEGKRRRQVPRSSSTSTLDMQRRSLLRGLPDGGRVSGALRDDTFFSSASPSFTSSFTSAQQQKQLDPRKSLRAAKNRHAEGAALKKKKRGGSSRGKSSSRKSRGALEMSGWDD